MSCWWQSRHASTGCYDPGDNLGRLARDEFVVLCEDLADPSEADRIAVRFGEALLQPFILSGAKLRIDESVGIARTGRGRSLPEELIHDADHAMYRTKRHPEHGRGVLGLRERHLAEHQAGLARGLPSAGEHDELHVEYQPIVNTQSVRLTAVEALLRWKHPARGAVPPTVSFRSPSNLARSSNLGPGGRSRYVGPGPLLRATRA